MKEKKPIVVFFMETKLRTIKMEWVKIQLEFDNMFVVDCVGKSGGLALLWTTHARVKIKNFSRRHINAMVTSSVSAAPCKLIGFYGHLAFECQQETMSVEFTKTSYKNGTSSLGLFRGFQ